MSPIIAICVVLQASVLCVAIRQVRGRFLGKLGCLFILMSFAYHGFTEIMQTVFPDRNVLYRSLVTVEALDEWVMIVTGAIALFAAVYLHRLRRYNRQDHLQAVLSSLSTSALMRWPVLLGIGLLGFGVRVALSDAAMTQGTVAGLAVQFTLLSFVLAMGGLCLNAPPRKMILVSALFCGLLAITGARSQVFFLLLMSLSLIVRYGGDVRARTVLSAGALIALCFIAISGSRGAYGRFSDDDGVAQRLDALGSGIRFQELADSIIDDSVYRFDGNSYGAMVAGKQDQGYGITGANQFLNTIAYMIPSFLNRGKLETEFYLRNEEAYQDNFFGFDDKLDYLSVFWSVLIGYIGWIGLLVTAPFLGWGFAALDNWLARTASITSYLCGVTLSAIPLIMELGIAGIPGTLRGLAAILLLAHASKFLRKRSSIPGSANRFAVTSN